ncbi:ABC transporter permease subunit [Mycoplasma crocodyli]|uniref:Oligopeptide ABC transporter, permease protein n=1 Tax=Mycoplasma crocodyli (strain ATCC 51981 / MP145) TaxID=512564 RepID=D5E598_MYCCM|nr:ABC transporter permease subunit [Mycoplasma crocodyli]ADE19782.1 oligopeptide ABC transporter, permease protein [Mycoplasma crocodyli MP145]
MNKNKLSFAKNKSIQTWVNINPKSQLIQTFNRFFNKKTNYVLVSLTILIMLLIIFSLIFYPYSPSNSIINSSLIYNLPPKHSPNVTLTLENDQLYQTIKDIESNTDFKLLSDVKHTSFVTITYNSYDLIKYANYLATGVELNINSILGTNSLGIDNYSFFIHSFAISVLITLSAVLIQLALGSFLGVLIGYSANKSLKIPYYIISSISTVPYIIIALLLFNSIGYNHLKALLILGFIGIPQFFFSSYSYTQTIKNQEYVLASKAIGANYFRIVIILIWKEVLFKQISLFSENVSITLLILASLSFFNAKDINLYLNIGNVFKQVIDNFKNYSFSLMVIIITALYIILLKLLGINIYLSLNPKN